MNTDLRSKIIQSLYFENNYDTTTTINTSYVDILENAGIPWEISIVPTKIGNFIELYAEFSFLLGITGNSVGGGINIQKKIGNGSYSTIHTPISELDGRPFDLFTGIGNATTFSNYFRYPLSTKQIVDNLDIITFKFGLRSYYSGQQSTVNLTNLVSPGRSIIILREVSV